MTASGSGDLRTAQRDVTRQRIAHAVVEAVVADGLEHLSFPAVAERAGTSLRTVYRHYPNKEALLGAAVDLVSDSFANQYPVEERTLATMGEVLPAMWARLHDNIDLIRVQHTTAGGVELRAQRLRERQASIVARLAADAPEVPAGDRKRLAAIVAVLMGTPVLVDLVEHLGLSVHDAATLAVSSIEAVVEAARTNGGIPR